MQLDRWTRIYLTVLGVLALLAVVAWLWNRDPRVAELNAQLARDAMIADYPYRFRVLAIEDKTAVVLSPRSPQVPAVRFLAALEPGLRGKSDQDPDMIAAQHRLGLVQSQVGARLKAYPGIERLRWQLDVDWYAQHGIVIP